MASNKLSPTKKLIKQKLMKKELIGNHKNGGADYRPKADPKRVKVQDFQDISLGKVAPCRVNDVTANEAWVSVGITADCGGSNSARVKLWKVELQKLVDETRLTLQVHHYPPGTSKWNRIEQRLFCHTTQNWRGRPLSDRMSVVELISQCDDDQIWPQGRMRTRRANLSQGYQGLQKPNGTLDIPGDEFHPEWNYTIKPGKPKTQRLFLSIS